MKKYIINLVEKADPSYIFVKIFRYFISACGFTLLLCFFSGSMESYTRENTVNMVNFVFLLECILVFFNNITLALVRGTDTRTYAEPSKNKSVRTYTEPDKNKRILAVHEAGHAVMAYLKNAKKFDINMINGCVETDYFLVDAETCKEHIMVVYAGAIAEELEFGHFCTGSFGCETADFESATKLIKGYITMTDKTVSKALLEDEINTRIIEISKELYAESEELLKKHKNMVSHLADNLMSKDSLKTEEVREILDSVYMTCV